MLTRKMVILATTAFMFACSASQATDLNGQWQLTQVSEKSALDTTSTLTFDSKMQAFSVNVGCNNFFGKYHTDKNNITFSKPASTKRACPENLASLERILSDKLAHIAIYQIEKNQLKIYDDKGIIIFSATR